MKDLITPIQLIWTLLVDEERERTNIMNTTSCGISPYRMHNYETFGTTMRNSEYYSLYKHEVRK